MFRFGPSSECDFRARRLPPHLRVDEHVPTRYRTPSERRWSWICCWFSAVSRGTRKGQTRLLGHPVRAFEGNETGRSGLVMGHANTTSRQAGRVVRSDLRSGGWLVPLPRRTAKTEIRLSASGRNANACFLMTVSFTHSVLMFYRAWPCTSSPPSLCGCSFTRLFSLE